MENDLNFEAEYWGDCTNTVDEDTKHYVYAKYMGLSPYYPHGIDRAKDAHVEISVLDIGGGPTSMLLKMNKTLGTVVDPLMNRFPQWVRDRYACKGLLALNGHGEKLSVPLHNESWIYNVLQHTEDPREVIATALRISPVLRFFEWCYTPPHEGHPNEITPDLLKTAFHIAADARGKKAQLTIHCNQPIAEMGCHGHAFAGVVELV